MPHTLADDTAVASPPTPDTFRDWLAPVLPLTDAQWDRIAARLLPVRLAASEAFIEQGGLRRWVGFVHSGALRYSVLRDGTEHVTAFDFEGDVAGDLAAFFDAMPASTSVTAIEPSEIMALTHGAFSDLTAEIPALAEIRQAVGSQLFAGAQARAAELQQFSAEERYRRLLRRSPHVVQRVPLYHVASYLGVTPEALSRIRRRVATPRSP